MNLTELVQYVLLESGQFIVSTTLDDFQLDYDKFWLLTKPILLEYEKYKPYTWTRNQYISRVHTFSAVVDDDQLPAEEQKIVENIPKWISSCLPVGQGNVFNIPNSELFVQGIKSGTLGEPMSQYSAAQPTQWLWNYKKPKLYCPYTGTLDLVMHGPYLAYEDYATGGALKDVEIPDLEYNSTFIKYVTGRFLVTIGRSRRAFTLTDIPVTLDSETLVTEGETMIAEAKEALHERSDWHLGLGD